MADSKKKLTKAVAVATAAALLLGGTFAWQSISQTALNEASDVINPGGRLHDDFYIDADGNYNSDIYVENFADDEIFARVRLEEYFEIVTNKGLVSSDGTLLETVHTVAGSKTLKDGAVADPVNNPTGKNLYDYTYETHYFDQENDTDEYWTLTPGDVDSETVYYMPTFNKNKDSLVPDRNGMYVDRVGGISDQSPSQYEDYYVWSDGEESIDNAIYDADSDDIDQYAEGNGAVDVNWIEVEETHTAKAVGTSNGLISMSEWQDLLANDEPTGEYWVYDEDGWVYWTSPIAKDAATGLLLDSISLDKVMDDSWYYALNAIGQFITANDLGSEEDGTGFYDTTEGPAPSDNALALLEAIGVDVTGEAGGGDDVVTGDFTAELTLADVWDTGEVTEGTLTYDAAREAYVYEGDANEVHITPINMVDNDGEPVIGVPYNRFQLTGIITKEQENVGNGRYWYQDINSSTLIESRIEDDYYSGKAIFYRDRFAGEQEFVVVVECNGLESAPIKIIMTGTSEPTIDYEIAITGEDVLASDDTTGVPVALYADGEEVTEGVTWYVSPNDGTTDVRAEVVDGKLRAVESPVMAAPLEGFVLEAHIDGDYVADITFYMYDAEEHILTSVETVADSENTYYLFSHTAATFIEMPSIDVCAWRYGDEVTEVYTYTIEGNHTSEQMAAYIDSYIVNGELPSAITSVAPCGHLTTE